MLENKKILLILAPVCHLPSCTCIKLQMSLEPWSAPGQIELPAARDQPLSPCNVPHAAILEVIIQSICYPTVRNFNETRFLSNSLHSADANGHFYFSITTLNGSEALKKVIDLLESFPSTSRIGLMCHHFQGSF